MKCESVPVFVIGRQHSGNTMLALILGKTSTAISLVGEGDFFEYWPQLDALKSEDRAKRVAELIRKSASPRLTLQVYRDLLSALLRKEDAPAIALYLTGMNYLASRQGKSRWVQKATSYIFYVEVILKTLTKANLIFLARNPLDIAASLKRRGNHQSYMRMVWGWNRGMRLAQQYSDMYPDNFRIFRYEDLANEPEPTVRQICSTTGLEFTSECLQISHVNRSESPYCQSSEMSGINSSRVFYYQDILTSSEELAIRLGIDSSLLSWLYPDLPDAPGALIKGVPNMIGFSLLSGRTFLMDHLKRFVSDPYYAIRRVWCRI